MTRPQDAPQQPSDDDLERIDAQLAGVFGPSHAASEPTERQPDETWYFDQAGTEITDARTAKGTAWVFYAKDHTKLTNPLIASDGFQGVPSKLADWSVLWSDVPNDPKGYAWGKDLSEQGKDLILLGYTGANNIFLGQLTNRTASILDTATIAKACIKKAIQQRGPNGTPLVVGGFSMGGLITRYTLALMEWELRTGVDGAVHHEASTYFSYDSPHRGGWVPISIQAFAHYLKAVSPFLGSMSNMLNSPASRELAAYHIATHTGNPTPKPDPSEPRFSRSWTRSDGFRRTCPSGSRWRTGQRTGTAAPFRL